MSTLQPRTIKWIDSAPVRIAASARSTASPDAVFAVLADHERWPEWFTSVKSVEVIGASAAGVGARRRVKVPGLTVDEEFIVWEPGVRWSFTGLEARPGVTRSLVEDCRLTPVADDGGTDITYTMYLDPPAWLRPVVAVLSSQLRRNNTKAMENLARRAAKGS